MSGKVEKAKWGLSKGYEVSLVASVQNLEACGIIDMSGGRNVKINL